MPMTKLPSSVKNYVESNYDTPVGLIGCRVAASKLSFDCCEFDLAVFCNTYKNRNLLNIGKYTIEVITLPVDSRNVITLKDMCLVKDFATTYPLTTAHRHTIFKSRIDDTDYTRALLSHGKKKILESLFYFDRIGRAFKRNPVLGSMWLKLSAYEFLEGVVSLSGQRPMPFHELQQIRLIDSDYQIVSNGIQIALDCIGIERANRSTVSRSGLALERLYGNGYDKGLVFGKISSLLRVGMLPDCYYYIGKMAKKQLLKRDERFYETYSKLVQIALDLSSDNQQNQKLHSELSNTAKSILKYYRNISVA